MPFPFNPSRRCILLLCFALASGNSHAASLSVSNSAPLADSFSLEVQYDDANLAFLQHGLDLAGIRVRFLADFDALQSASAPGTSVLIAYADDGSTYRLKIQPASTIFGDGMDNRDPRYDPSMFSSGSHVFDFLVDPADGSVRLSIDDMPYRSDVGIVAAGTRITRIRFGYPHRSQTDGSARYDNVTISEPGSLTVALDDGFESGDTSLWEATVP